MKIKREHAELSFILILSLLLLLANVSEIIVMVIASLLVVNFALSKKEDWEDLGITTKGVWPAIKAQMPFTLLGIAALLAYALLGTYQIGPPRINLLAYWLVSVPLQEFLFRGYAQSVFRKLLPTMWNAALVSIGFSVLHVFARVPYAPILVAVTLVSGFAWGFAYEKKRNLLGPIVSHAILGSLIFIILG